MSRSLRRLMKEASELSSAPSPHFHAAPTSDSNLFDWHFTLAGPPPPSPYAGGIYHGRIVLPATYPLRPPSFRFLTPSGRFEVNREICLSISGHHEESWQPAWGIRTALLAIRSFMEGDARGQVGGLEGVSDEIRRQWAGMSRGWCCEVCGGRSNEDVLREWRGFCVEQGVDVEKEEDVEGVPEELRIGIGKKEKGEGEAKEGENGSAAASTDGVVNAATNRPSDGHTTDTAGTSTNTSTPSGPGESAAPSSTTAQAPVSVNTRAPVPISPAATQQQPRLTPTRASAPPAQVASQDSPWLDRAIFGVLVALILMILRRFVNVED